MRISKEKKDKISEQILSLLYHSFPKQLFTAAIAKETARDEEFIKNLLFELKDKLLVVSIKKNEAGLQFIRRINGNFLLKPIWFMIKGQRLFLDSISQKT